MTAVQERLAQLSPAQRAELRRLIGPKGIERVDRSTGELVKKTAISKNAELNSAILDTYFTDYTEVQGVKIPFKTTHKIKEQTVLTVTIKKCELNQPIPDDIFSAAAANPSPAGASPSAGTPSSD